MWLLSTARAEFRRFLDYRTVDYAILSHAWGESEQTFQDIQRVIDTCRVSGTNPRDHVADKIRRCCEQAEVDGYQWVWMDMCCIDKTSSAELSEAINSMYNWYGASKACYAYLEDVQSDEDPFLAKSTFRKSRWFTRGWTLQEIIAPTNVAFMAHDWLPIGEKLTMAGLLEEVTGIDSEVLRHERNLEDISIAARMSWAARRQTTLEEDEAYCLVGIFAVNIPTIYGEGRRAFYRLQEEILKRSRDQSIFAWGRALKSADQVDEDLNEEPPDSSWERFSPMGRYFVRDARDTYLLAPAPSAFRDCAHITFIHTDVLLNDLKEGYFGVDIPGADFSPSMRVICPLALENPDPEVPGFTATGNGNGMRARLPVICVGKRISFMRFKDICSNNDRQIYGDSDFAIAILSCHDASGAYVGLLLRDTAGIHGHEDSDSTEPSFLPHLDVGINFGDSGAARPVSWFYYRRLLIRPLPKTSAPYPPPTMMAPSIPRIRLMEAYIADWSPRALDPVAVAGPGYSPPTPGYYPHDMDDYATIRIFLAPWSLSALKTFGFHPRSQWTIAKNAQAAHVISESSCFWVELRNGSSGEARDTERFLLHVHHHRNAWVARWHFEELSLPADVDVHILPPGTDFVLRDNPVGNSSGHNTSCALWKNPTLDSQALDSRRSVRIVARRWPTATSELPTYQLEIALGGEVYNTLYTDHRTKDQGERRDRDRVTNGDRSGSGNGDRTVAELAGVSDDKAATGDRCALERDKDGSLHEKRRRTKWSILRAATCGLWFPQRREDRGVARFS